MDTLLAVEKLDNGYLLHYGVKGQQRGKRRWQYPDGTYTPEGRIHYGIGQGRKGGQKEDKPKTNHKKELIDFNKSFDKYQDDLSQKLLQKISKNIEDVKIEDRIRIEDKAYMDASKKFWDKARELDKIDFTQENLTENISTIFKTLPILPVSIATTVATVGQGISQTVENKRFERRLKEREQNDKIDPKTGLYLKNEDTGVADDIKVINHNFYGFDTRNTNNCMLCTNTYELRRRGFDVFAGQSNVGFDETAFARWYKNPKVRSIEFKLEAAKRIRESGKEPNDKSVQKLSSKLALEALSKEPDGSRGNLIIDYKVPGAHSMIYEIENGKLTFRDAQDGTVVSSKAALFAIAYIRAFCRTDNLEINYDQMKKDGAFV